MQRTSWKSKKLSESSTMELNAFILPINFSFIRSKFLMQFYEYNYLNEKLKILA